MLRLSLVLLMAAAAVLGACTSPLADEAGGGKAPAAPGAPANLAEISPGLWTGADPDSPESFDALASLGIVTIVSVDGARPDVASARARGMRYVHVPIGYDHVSAEARAALAKTMREAEGPVYVHCHHGKHRGPIAAGFAAACAEGIDGSTASTRLASAGYPRKYEALYRELESFDPAALDERAVVAATLREAVDPGSMASAMAAIDRTWDRVKACRDAGWTVPAAHPDVEPAHEARILAERFREVNRLMVEGEPAEFRALMDEAEEGAWALSASLRRGDEAGAGAAVAAVASSCRACHDAYRN